MEESKPIDIRELIAQGYVVRDCETSGGKLKFSIRSQTLSDRLTYLGVSEKDRGIVLIGLGLSEYNGKKFKSQDDAIDFVRTLNPAVARKLRESQEALEDDILSLVDKWAKEILTNEESLTDESIINSILNGDRVTESFKDKESGVSIVLQTLTLDEEVNATSGKNISDQISEADYANLQCDYLMAGIKSINNIEFKNQTETFNGIRQLPNALVGVIFKWHTSLISKVREVLNKDGNF